jgi:5-(carboxyamino)imidazole ribonucleotide synthase
MSSNYKTGLKIGMLGGGQLGRMLIQEAINLNLDILVLDPDKDAPCKNLTSHFVCGSLNDYQTVINFAKDLDILTIEIEHVNIEALKFLQNSGVKVYPQPEFLEIIQDKGKQKQFYKENNIPTAPFYLVNNREEIKNYTQHFPFFQKLCKGGYDGKGVYRLDEITKIENAFDAPSVLEKLVPFEREIAVIVSRNFNGEIAVFPAVDMEFNPQANLVEYLYSPSSLHISILNKAQEIARTVIEKAKMVGVLAVEMFVTAEGEILVNEVAPRPHNSGHQTIEGNVTSQYAQHLRAICNLPMGDTSIRNFSAMVNILGEPGFTGEAIYQGLDEVLKTENVFVHLYGKKITKPFRKMGHITICGDNENEVKQKAKSVKEKLKVISK